MPENGLRRFHRRLERRMFPNEPNWRHEYAQRLTGDRALHLGCGRDIQRIRELRSSAVGLDIDADLLTHYPNPRLRGDAHRLPFRDASFDLVFSEFVFEHLPDPWAAIAEAERVLAPGGRLVIWVPNREHYYARITNATPHAFHEWWVGRMSTLSAGDVHETEFKFGSAADIREVPSRTRLALDEIVPVTGPTSYTIWLPLVHPLVLLGEKARERLISAEERCHSFIASYVRG